MDEIVKKKDQVWVARFRDVVAYHKERNSSELSVLKESIHKWKLSLTDMLSNNAAYQVPLTIQVKNPSGWSVKSIKQDRKKIAYHTTIDSIQFDAIPDAGEFILTKRANQ
jgi:hypothetical protein